ncbi:MAG: hypothetical protein ACW97Z_11355 [Candidatus Hodarchaeales archaeon]|jgi:hypothetical protein
MSEKLHREIERLEIQAKKVDREIVQKQDEVEKIRKKILFLRLEMKKKLFNEKEKLLKKIEKQKKSKK